jgi:hypothetical protein
LLVVRFIVVIEQAFEETGLALELKDDGVGARELLEQILLECVD